MIATVAYDLMGMSLCGSIMDWNLQVWLDTYGDVTPPGSVTHTLEIGGKSFKLWQGFAHGMRTHTFVAETTMKDYTGDLMDFVDWSMDNLQVRPHWCIYGYQGGTQAFKGTNATFIADGFYLREVANTPGSTPIPPPAASIK